MDIIRLKKRPVIVHGFRFVQKEAEAMVKVDTWPDIIINGARFNVEKTAIGSMVFEVDTLEGPHRVTDGDWVMIGIEGEHYAIKDRILRKTYDILHD